MPLPISAEKTKATMQSSSNPKKRKLGHDEVGNLASPAAAAGSASPRLQLSHTKTTSQNGPKRLRPNRSSPISAHVFKTTPSSPPRGEGSPKPVAALLLRPCHVCWRRPTTRAVLDAYADCDECGLRTCYICLRVCEDTGCRFATVGLQEKEEIEDVTPESRIAVYTTRMRRKRLCSWCTVEQIDTDGNDMTRCLDCADRDRDRWPRSNLSGKGRPP